MTVTDSTTSTDAPEVIEGEVVSDEAVDAPSQEDGTDAPAQDEPSQEVAVQGEVVEEPGLSKAEAKKLTTQIKRELGATVDSVDKMNASMERAADLMGQAYNAKIHLSMEYGSWEDYVTGELGEARFRLDRVVRRGLVYQMASHELSTRAVAAVLGVDQKTVSNDLRRERQERGETGSDSVKTRDGKTQKKATRTRRQKPLADRFTAAIEAMDKPVGDLVDLSVSAEWESEAGEVAKRHRAQVARYIDSLTGVLNRMQGAE